MKKEAIFDKLKNLLNEGKFMSIRNIDENIKHGTSLIKDLALDSIQIIELIISIEKEFGISFDAEELDLSLFDNIDDTVNFIMQKMCKSNV